MRRYPFPPVRARTVLLLAFVLAEALLLTGTWQFAFLAGFVAGMFSARLTRAALLGGLGVAAAWAAYLVYVFAVVPGAALAGLVGQIFGLGPGAWWFFTLLTLVLGLLVGAVGGLTGHAGAQLFLWEETPAAMDAPKG